MADDCIFCKIVAGVIDATRVFENDHVLAFVDTNPQAPTHLLVVPKDHYADLPDIGRNADAAASYLAGIGAVVEDQGLTDFRVVFNTGSGAGQTVFHVHAHVLAGRPVGWPPG